MMITVLGLASAWKHLLSDSQPYDAVCRPFLPPPTSFFPLLSPDLFSQKPVFDVIRSHKADVVRFGIHAQDQRNPSRSGHSCRRCAGRRQASRSRGAHTLDHPVEVTLPELNHRDSRNDTINDNVGILFTHCIFPALAIFYKCHLVPIFLRLSGLVEVLVRISI